MAGDFISRGGREFRVPWKGTSKGPEARQCKVCGLKAPGTNTLARPVIKGALQGQPTRLERQIRDKCSGPGTPDVWGLDQESHAQSFVPEGCWLHCWGALQGEPWPECADLKGDKAQHSLYGTGAFCL